MKNKIVITKTPLRVSFFGGGTDIEHYYKHEDGMVVSTAINKYVYVTAKQHSKLFRINYRLNYSKTENCTKINDIKNNIVRECLKFLKIRNPLYISVISDIPDKSGLGSSSSFCVGLLNCLHKLIGKKVSKKKLAEIAYLIENRNLDKTIGKQDQYAAAFGGTNLLIFKKNNKVIVKKIIKNKIIQKILNNSTLIWTGIRRQANKILEKQKKNSHKNIPHLNSIKDNVKIFLKLIENNNLDLKLYGNLLQKSWFTKLKLVKSITNKKIDKIIRKLNKNRNIFGTKLLGAGGGGFILCLGYNFKKIKKDYNCIDFKEDNSGSTIIYEE